MVPVLLESHVLHTDFKRAIYMPPARAATEMLGTVSLAVDEQLSKMRDSFFLAALGSISAKYNAT